MTDFIFFIVRLALFVFGLYIAYKIFLLIKEIVELIKRKKAADELRRKLDVFSVEGEVLNFTSKRVSRLDTQYDINISYEVDDITYYKYIVLFNRGSLRVGQKVILLCDNDNPENVVVQNGEEEEALKILLSRLVFMIVLLLLDAWGNSRDVLDITYGFTYILGG